MDKTVNLLMCEKKIPTKKELVFHLSFKNLFYLYKDKSTKNKADVRKILNKFNLDENDLAYANFNEIHESKTRNLPKWEAIAETIESLSELEVESLFGVKKLT